MKRKPSKLRRSKLTSCEHRSDKRTAEFVVRRLTEIQEDLSDLLPDLRTFEHYSEMEDIGWALRVLQQIKRKYSQFADVGRWEEK
jgi:hypothetical protein